MLKLKTRIRTPLFLSPEDAGRRLTPRRFDEADFEEGWRYELIQEVLVVTPIPRKASRGLAGKLIQWLQNYADRLGKGIEFLTALFEETIELPNGSRRRCDVGVWIELGRNPGAHDVPTITVEIVSKRASDVRRDYVDKRADYLAAGVQEYWIIDRFRRTMTVLRRRGGRWQQRVVQEDEVYTTPLLPGFELKLRDLLAHADALAQEN